jgi:hypothetical protein
MQALADGRLGTRWIEEGEDGRLAAGMCIDIPHSRPALCRVLCDLKRRQMWKVHHVRSGGVQTAKFVPQKAGKGKSPRAVWRGS